MYERTNILIKPVHQVIRKGIVSTLDIKPSTDMCIASKENTTPVFIPQCTPCVVSNLEDPLQKSDLIGNCVNAAQGPLEADNLLGNSVICLW